MQRMLGAIVVVVLCAGGLMADDTKDKGKDNKNKTKHKATITNVDTKKGTVTVKMKDKNGKEQERTFKLTEEIRYVDSTGKVAAADIFRSGDEVLIVEEEGRLKEVHKAKNPKEVKDKTPAVKDKTPEGKPK